MAENGSVEADKQEVKISNADAVTLLIDVRTDYKNPDYKELCMKTVNDVSRKSYKILKQSHIEDYSRLFNRVELNLGQDTNGTIPTDVRWKQVLEGKVDTSFDALYFQY